MNGDYEECSLDDLKRLLKLRMADWQQIKQKNLLHQLREAAGKNKLSVGVEDVRCEVINRRGRILLLEKQYLSDTNLLASGELNYKTAESYNKFSCIKNPIDEMIDKVLENGGEVEFVSNGFLEEYSHIALIKNY